eukprot:gene7377-501_t
MELDVFTPAVVYKKIYWNVLPVFCCIAALCYIDRTNLAYASFGLARDLGFTPEVYGLGSGLFFLGYSLAMIPSQGRQSQELFQGRQSQELFQGQQSQELFQATMWYYLSLMLPPDAMTIPLSVLEASVSMANVASPLLAAALMGLEGLAGMRGWQWLFVSEGAPTIAVGFIVLMVLPRSLHKAEFLTVTERRCLAQKLDTSGGNANAKPIPATFELHMLWEALNNQQVMWVSLMGLLKNIAANGMIFWTPIIVAAILDHDRLEDPVSSSGPAYALSETLVAPNRSLLVDLAANLTISTALSPLLGQGAGHLPTPSKGTSTMATVLCSVPFLASAIFTLWLGHRSQAKGEKALHLAVPYLVAGVLFTIFPFVTPASPMVALVILCVVISCTTGSNSIINSYIPTIASKQSLPVAYAVYNAIANLGSLVGPWLIGEVVATTGSYANAIKLLGVVMCVASAMAFSTRSWGTSTMAKKERQYDEDNSISRLLEESSVLDL